VPVAAAAIFVVALTTSHHAAARGFIGFGFGLLGFVGPIYPPPLPVAYPPPVVYAPPPMACPPSAVVWVPPLPPVRHSVSRCAIIALAGATAR